MFADGIIDAQQLATSGGPYVLAVVVLACCYALKSVYADLKTSNAASVRMMQEQEQMFVTAIRESRDAIKEARMEFTESLKETRVEFREALREITTNIGSRLESVEGTLKGCQHRHSTPMH